MAVAESTSSTGGSADKPPPEEVTNASTTTSTTTESDEKAYFDYPAIRARLKERFEELRMPEKYMCWTRVGEPWGDEEDQDKDKKKDGETKDGGGGGGGGPPGSGSGGGDRVLRELFQPQVPPVSAPPEVNGARTVVGAAAHQDDDICSRLPIQYVNLFGLHPRLDPILTVKCRMCAMVLLQAAFTGHVDRRHKAEVAKYKCRDKKTGEIFPLSQLGRRGEEGADVEVMPNDELVEGEEQVNGLPFELGTQNGPPVPVPPTVGGGVQPSQPNQQRFLALHDLMDPSTIKSEGGDSFRTQPLTLQPQPLTQQPQQPRTFGTKSFSVIPGNYVVSSANQVLPGPGPSGSGSILATKSQPLAVAVKSSATLSGGTGGQQQPRVPPLKINLKSGAATPVITVRTQPSVVTSSTTTPQQHHIITTGKPMITRISTPARFSSPSPMVIQNITNIGGGTSIGPGFHSIGKGASVTVTMGGGTPTQATKSMLQQQSPSGQMSSPLVTALKRGTTSSTPMVVSNEQSMLTSKTSNLNTVAIKNYLSKQILEKQQLKQDSTGSTPETASSLSNQSMEKISFTIDEVIKKVGTMDEDDEYEDLFSDDEHGDDDDDGSSLDVATPSDGGSSFHSFLNEDILSGMTREVPKEPLPKGSIASEVYAIIPAANSGDNPMIVSSFTGEEVSGVIKPPKSKGKTKDAPTKSKVKSSKSTASGASAGTSASSSTSTPSTSSHPSILTLTPEMAAQVKKKFIPCDKRLFDPEEHCGVQIPGMKKPCTRSLTCRMHLIALRRGVERPRPFEELLAEYKQVRGIKGNRDRVRGTGTGSKKKQPDTSGSEGGAHSPMIKLEGSGGKFMIKKEAKDYKKKPSSTANKPRSSSPAIATSVSPLPSNIVHLIPSPLSIKEEEEDEIVEFEEEDDLLGGQDDFDLSFELPSFEDEEPMVISPSPRSSQSTSIIPNLPLVQLIPSAHHSSSTIVHSSHVQPQLVSQMVSSVPITLPPQLNTLSMVIGSAVAPPPPPPQLPMLSIPLEPITVSADEADDEDDEEVMDDDRDHDDDSNSADSDRPIRSCIIWDPNCKPIDESVYPRPAVAGPSDFRSSVVYCTGFSREQQQAQKTARHPFLYGMTFDDTSSGDDSSSSSNDSKPTIEPPTPTSASSTVSQQVNLNVETMTIDSSDNSSSSQVGPSCVTPSKATPSKGTPSMDTSSKGTPSKGTPSMGTPSKLNPTCTSSTTFSMIQSISSPTIVTRPLQQSSSPSLHHSFATASPKSSATSAASSQQQPQQVGTKSILLGTRPFSSLKVSPSPSSSSTLVHKFASASPLVSSSSHVVGSSSSLSSSQLVSQLQQQHQQQRQNQQKLQQQQQQRQPQQNQQQPQQPTTKQIYVSMSLPSKQSTSVRVQPTSTATSSSGSGTNIKQLTTTVQLNQLATKSSAGGNQFQVLHNRNIALHNIVPMMSSSSSSTSSVTSTVSATVSQQQQPTIAIKSSSSSPEPKTLKSLLNSATLLTLNPSSDKHTKTMVPATTSTKAIAVKSLPVSSSSSSHLTLATRSTPGHQVSSGIVRGPTGQFQRRQLVATTTTAASTVQNILLQNPSIRPRAASTTASATVSATTPSRSTSSTSSTSATSSTLQVRTPSTRRSSSFTEHSGSKDKIIEDIKTDLIQSYELKRRSSLQQLTSTSGSFDASGAATSGTTAVAGFELGGNDSTTTSHLPDDIFDIIEDLENTTNSSSQNISLDDDDLQLLSDSATTQLPISNLIITTTTPGTLPIGSSSAITGSGTAAVVSRSTTGTAGTTMVVGTASGSGAAGSSNSYILLPISSINSSGQGQNFYILQNPSGGTSNLTIGAAAGAGGGSGSQQSTGAQQPTILGLPSGGGGGTSGQQTLVLQPIARQIQQQQTGGQANVVQSGNIQLQPANSSGQVSQQQQQQQSGQIQVQLYPANKKFKQG